MRMFKLAGMALLGTLVPLSGAVAADIMTVPTSAAAPIEMPIAEGPGFDWSGFYAGVFGGVQDSELDGLQYGAGLNAGVNAAFDFYLLGAEVAVQGLTGETGEASYGQLLGRAGLIVTDDVMVYAAGGYGLDLGDTDEGDYLLGGGVEMAVTESVSLRAQYLHGFPTDGGNDKNQFTVGAQYHF
jgi:outer membrane immunogenic protein